MYKIIATLCLFAFCGASALPRGSVSLIQPTSAKLSNPFGVVEGIEACESTGQITQVRFTDCTRVPCTTNVGSLYTLEIDFIPTFSHDILSLKVRLFNDQWDNVIVDEPVQGSAVEAGGHYTLTYNIPVSGSFIGFSNLRVEVIGNDIIELCAIAAVDVVVP